jgi:hypothetical protein
MLFLVMVEDDCAPFIAVHTDISPITCQGHGMALLCTSLDNKDCNQEAPLCTRCVDLQLPHVQTFCQG